MAGWVSSLKVRKNEDPYPYANGKWIQVASGDIDLTYTLGVTSTQTTSVTSAMTHELSVEMTRGIEMKTVESEKKIAYTY